MPSQAASALQLRIELQSIQNNAALIIQRWWRRVQPIAPRSVCILCLFKMPSLEQNIENSAKYEMLRLQIEANGFECILVSSNKIV